MARFQSGTEFREVVLEGDERLAYCERQRALLATGFHRVCDPAREVDYPEDEPRDAAIERALHDNPDDDHTWLVYADRYIDRGHPRGQLMALESAPVRTIVERAQREADARRLRRAAGDVLAAGLGRPGLSLKWRRGFIHHAKLHGGFARGAAEDLLFDLLRHPSARFLRELVIDCWHHDAEDLRLVVDLLLHAAMPPPLRLLHLDYTSESWNGFAPLGDLGTLGTVYPQLEDVRIEGDDSTSFAGLALPRAKRFAFNTTNALRQTLQAIAAAPWPVLEEIELWLENTTATLDDVRFVLELPAVCDLRILAVAFANGLVEALVASPLASRIELLDMRYSRLDDRGVAMLVAARDRLHAELAVRFDHTAVSTAGREQLADANVRVDDMWRW